MESIPIIYYNIHIPRTGGTTFNCILKKIFQDAFFRVYDEETNRDKEKIIFLSSGIKCLSGHRLSYPAPDMGNYEFRYLTFIRHPWKRCLSLYAYEKENGFGGDLPSDLNLNDWLDMKFSNDYDFSNYQSSSLFGTYDPKIKFSVVKKILKKFFFIGITERFDESLVLFSHKLNTDFINIVYQIKNITESQKVDNLNLLAIKEFLNRNKTDFKMYAYTNSILNKSIKKLRIDLKYELNEFQAIQKKSMSLRFDNLEKTIKNKNNEIDHLKKSLEFNERDSHKRLERIKDLQAIILTENGKNLENLSKWSKEKDNLLQIIKRKSDEIARLSTILKEKE